MHMKTLVALVAAISLIGAVHADTPKNPKIERTVSASVTVTKLDVAKRHLTIRNDAGDEYTIDVDPAVKNLSQVKVGDKIVVTYNQSVAASLVKPGAPTAAANQVEAQTAKEGQKPGATARSTTTIPVTLVSVDAQKNVVEFRDADGLVRSTDVVSPEGKAFIKNLKAGDEVMLTYTESVAISVNAAK
jgi:translation elongation factor P/translation initiation factor 5A